MLVARLLLARLAGQARHNRSIRPVRQFLQNHFQFLNAAKLAKPVRTHADFTGRLRSFDKLKSTHEWPLHPAFGRLSTNEWGVLGYKHTNHHLTQFGV